MKQTDILIFLFSPMSEDSGYKTIMTIFCDVNMNGGYYISPEYKADDNKESQQETEMKEYNHADEAMEEYNKDGNMEEYAERMAKEAAAAAAAAVKDEKMEEYNLDGNMEEYAERMAKEAAAKEEKMEEYNLDGNMEEYAERMAQETAAAAAAAAVSEVKKDDEYAPYKAVKDGMSDEYKKKYGNKEDYAKYMEKDGENMGEEYNKDGNMEEYAERMAKAAAESAQAAHNTLGEKFVDGEYNKDGNMEEYEEHMAAQAAAAAAAAAAESPRAPQTAMYVPFAMAPQPMNADAEAKPNAGPIPELFMPPVDGAQFKVQYYHPMHYHYYPYYPMPQSSAPMPVVSYHHQYTYKSPSASQPGGHTYHGGYFGYAKKTN